MFINKDADMQYTAYNQKKITGLLEKKVFEVVFSENFLSNI